jgi:hypothetical protein
VVLLTDGLESNRRARPVKAAAAIKASGARLDVVSLCVANTERLERMAEAGGGSCYSASDADQLLKAFKTAVLGEVTFAVLTPDGKEVAKGKSGDRIRLPAGPYVVEIPLGDGIEKADAWVHPERTTRLRIRR